MIKQKITTASQTAARKRITETGFPFTSKNRASASIPRRLIRITGILSF